MHGLRRTGPGHLILGYFETDSLLSAFLLIAFLLKSGQQRERRIHFSNAGDAGKTTGKGLGFFPNW